jgi:hypothetical protein
MMGEGGWAVLSDLDRICETWVKQYNLSQIIFDWGKSAKIIWIWEKMVSFYPT